MPIRKVVYEITCEDRRDAQNLAEHLEKNFFVSTSEKDDRNPLAFTAAVSLLKSDELEDYLKTEVIEYEWVETY